MSRPARLLLLALAVIAAGCLAAGCAQGANLKKALSSVSPGGTTGVSAPASSPFASSRPVFSPTRTPASPTAPATVHHTVTAPAAPTATAPSSPAAPSPSSSQTTGSTASSLVWLWILLGVLLITIVAIVVARRSHRRSAVTASWRSQVADASAKGSALYDAISLAEFQGAWDTADAGPRWADIQRRADDLTQLLYRLRDSAPTEEERVRVTDVLTSLQEVRSAMEAAHTPGGAATQQGARMHYLLQSFDASLRTLRAPDVYGS